MSKLESICVFCASSIGARPLYAESARRFGEALAAREITLVFGGGCVGLMGVLADATLGAGGRAIGVIPRALAEREIAHRGLTTLHVVETMHERKQRMADLADAFVMLPGGFGSWDEFCEVVTWAQLGFHRKPLGVLNVAGYYDPILEMADRAVAEGFVSAVQRDRLIVDDEGERLLDRLAAAPMPSEVKWLPAVAP
ncbi:MAG TPA: TIGR00730 family Rossman fold protein [Gemmatimonadaceae bacterium]|nr:TIGR00730 family Rossman fold protein [Gemmatimonadaceae bacterium]